LTLDAPQKEDTYLNASAINVLFTLLNGSTHRGRDYSHYYGELLFLDYADSYDGELSGMEKIESWYIVNEGDDICQGDCSDFSWINRNKGQFHIGPRESKTTVWGIVIPDITGLLENGESVHLGEPGTLWTVHIEYLIADKNRYWPINWE
jgi:hypothetical protein